MRLPVFNPAYNPLIFSVTRGFLVFTTPFGRDLPCLRLPSNPPTTARTAGRSVRSGAFTTPGFSPAHFSARRNSSEIRPKPLQNAWAAIVTLLHPREATQRLTGADTGHQRSVPPDSLALADVLRRLPLNTADVGSELRLLR